MLDITYGTVTQAEANRLGEASVMPISSERCSE